MTPSITDRIRNIWKPRMPPPVLYPFLILLVLVPGWANAEIQTFTLQPGWNLISFPVLPQDHSPAMVFGAMKRVRGGQPLYQPNGSSSLRVALPAGIDPEGRFPNSGDCPKPPLPNDTCTVDPLKQTPPLPNSCPSAPLQTLEFGKAYWVHLEGINQGEKFTLEGEPAPPTALPLTPGWVGFGLTGVDQPVNVQAFFGRDRFGGISKPDVSPTLGDVVRWDPEEQCFEYYYADDPDGSAITQIEQGRGYLVKVLKTPTPPFKPQLRLIQGTTVLSTTTSQRLTILPTDNELTLDVLTPEGGALTWAATLLPIPASASETAQGLRQEDLPFVFTLSTEAIGAATGRSEQPIQASVETATMVKGIAFAELGNQLKIKVNRTHLPPGRYLAKLDIVANTGEHRSYDLEVSATGLDGEWQGRATIDTVNNKSNPVPDIDLVLQLFRVEVGGQMQLRGLVDSQETLTSWPMDAQIIGYPVAPPTGSSVDTDFKNGFWIKAEYVLPPGDVNNYPYEYLQQDVKDATDSVTDLRYKTSAEGDRYYLDLADRSEKKPNFLNPTTRFLRRQVFLTGHLTGVDGAGRSTAQGLYKETLTGLLPEAIELEGTFTLTRESQLSFTRRPFIFTSDIDGFIKVEPKLLVHRALVLVDPRAQDLKGLTLIGPGERERYSLECLERTDQEEKVVARLLDPPRIQGTPWQPLELQRRPDKNLVEELKNNYRLCQFKETMRSNTLLSTWNGRDAKGTWTLAHEESASTKTNPVINWALLLYGVPMHSLEGHVVVQGSTGRDRFSDVQLQFNNLGDRDQWVQQILQFDPDTGAFMIDDLPGLHIQLVAKKSGYRDAEVDGLETEKDPRGYHNGIRAILPGDPTLKNPPPSHYTLTLQPLAQ